jgi:DNA-directed RNA polymerase specialized sigma24 family protein
VQAEQYLPPWRELNPDGSLSEPYGPPSAEALARRVAKHRDWSFRPPVSKEAAQHGDAAELAELVARLGAELPEGERKVYRAVYLDGHNLRWCARKWSVRRQTVQTWLKRLRARLLGVGEEQP